MNYQDTKRAQKARKAVNFFGGRNPVGYSTSRPFVLGVDVGTTGCKTMAVDRAGRVLAEGEASYPVNSPQPGWGEQDLDAVVAGVVASVRQCLSRTPGTPAALCVDGALHSITAVDRQGRPLIPVLTWADTRSEREAITLRRYADSLALYRRTGCLVHAIYPLAKICWLREHRPEIFEAARRFVSVKEYVLYTLTGQWVVDDSLASGSGLLNIHSHDWDEDVLALAGIGRERLSPVVPALTKPGGITPAAGRDLGVSAGTPVIVGASDAALSTLGTGGIAPHVFTVMVGSSGAVRLMSDQPLLDDQERIWCYILDRSHYLVGGAINNAGLVLRWFADHFGETVVSDAYESLITGAAQVGPGAAGLVMLPFLAGERSPGWNAQARGVLFGLSLHHDRRHVARAILEAVAYRLRSVFEVLEQVAGPAVEVRASGGFLHSSLWVQIVADVLGRSISIPGTANTSALGAALLGWHALGEIGDLQEAANLVPVVQVIRPDAEHHHLYSRLYRLYGDLYEQLGAAFAEIGEIQAAMG